MKIAGVTFEAYHLVFIITATIGALYFITILSQTAHGPPTSTNSIVMYNAGLGNSLIAIISPLIAISMLIKEADSKLFSILVWISFVVGVALSLVTVTRGITWVASNGTEKQSEVKDYTYLKDKKERLAAPYAVYISREKKCCGVHSFQDWIEIYKEVDDAEDKSKSSIRRPRKLPDFCCKKDVTYGCGNRAIDSLHQTLANAQVDCDDKSSIEKQHKCLNYFKALGFQDLPPVDPGKPDSYVERTRVFKTIFDLKTALDASQTQLMWISDPRIDPKHHKESVRSLPHVTKFCDKVSTKEKKIPVFVLYGGKARKASANTENALLKDGKVLVSACYPQEVWNEIDSISRGTAQERNCIEEIIPLNHFEHRFSFCTWLLSKKQHKFELEDVITIVENEGTIYTSGCGPYMIKFLDGFVISSMGFALILLILYFVNMMVFTHNYLTYVEAHLRILPMPRWYEPLPNENPPMHAYGDVDFIPDVGCRTLPLPPMRPRMELVTIS